MKIAYSCAGEGFGHVSRTVALVRPLAQKHEIEVFCSAQVDPFLLSRRPEVKVRRIPSFTFVKKKDRVFYFLTFLTSLPRAFAFPFVVLGLALLLRREGFQGVISDFDPYLAWAGRLAGLPVIQLNHPGIVQKFFTLSPGALVACFVSWLMEGVWTSRIHCSFFYGDVGPILRDDIQALEPTEGDYFVLNLKPEYRPGVEEVLARFPELKFQIFPHPGANYEKALEGCRAVISSAGHQTLSEALFLGKPVIAMPQKGQWEQTLNAAMVERCGRGVQCSLETLEEGLNAFLEAEEEIRQNCGRPYPGFLLEDGTQRTLQLIEAALAAPLGGDKNAKNSKVEVA